MTKSAAWLFLGLLAWPAHALKLEGRLEAGLGAMTLYVPDYRGADQRSVVFLPFPYLSYEGKTLQISREGLRANLFSADRLSLSLSMAATPPSDDDGHPPRDGVPELMPVFEMGPALDYQVAGDATEGIRLRLPVRAALATDFRDFDSAGWLAEPQVRWHRRGMMFGPWQSSTGAHAGLLWGSSGYHDYFYSVAPQFAQPGRPAYEAHSGYSGVRTGMHWSVHRDPWRLVTFVQYDWLEGVAFDDSPLFRSEHAVFAGLMVMYRLFGRDPDSPGQASE